MPPALKPPFAHRLQFDKPLRMNFRCLAWGSPVVLSLVFALAFAGGCGEDEKPPRNREQFCHSWAVAACSEDVVKYCQAEDAEACHDSQDEFCHELVPDDFSDEMGDECLEAVESAYKNGDLDGDELAVVLRLAEPCNGLIVGPGEEGESCTEHDDCDTSSGLECIRKADDDEGTCEVPAEVGGGRSCEAAQKTCEPGFYCNGKNCIEAGGAGDACTIQEQCGEGGFCGSDSLCADRLAVGSDCSADHECAEGICYEGVCTSNIRLARAEPLCDSLR